MLNFSKTTSCKQQSFVKEILNLLEYSEVFYFFNIESSKQNKVLRHWNVELAIVVLYVGRVIKEIGDS